MSWTIDDPSAHMQTAIYTGNGSANLAITNSGNSDLQPDFVWIKRRNGVTMHDLFDSVRGGSSILDSASNGFTPRLTNTEDCKNALRFVNCLRNVPT